MVIFNTGTAMRFLFLIMCFCFSVNAQKIAVVKYKGGGDWYANETALPNLIRFCNTSIQTTIDPKPEIIEFDNPSLFSFPYVHLTGHGNIVLSTNEIENLKKYLLAGGFLHIDDNYGLDSYIRREMKRVFPNHSFVELPITHEIFKKPYVFPNGTPKIHEHDGKRPQTFALFDTNGRIICLYTYETDLGNGWEDARVHNDPETVRTQALKMGANILNYVFSN